MRRVLFLWGFISISVSLPGLANMAPFHEGILASGNLNGQHSQLQIIDERLQIHLFENHAHVQVEYLIQNQGSAVTVKTGFPSIRISNGKEVSDLRMSSDGRDHRFETQEKSTKAYPYLGFCEPGVDAQGEPDEKNQQCEGSIVDFWYMTQLKFKQNESKKVVISYNSAYDQSGREWSYGDIEGSEKVFRYLLSTGSGWKGPIRKGRISIQAMGVNSDAFEIVSNLPFKPVHPAEFIHEFKNLEPKPGDDIVVSFRKIAVPFTDHGRLTPAVMVYGQEKYHELNYTATATSTLKQGGKVFDVSQLSDNNASTAWIEGVVGSGVGETLTLKDFKMNPTQLVILPGYGRSKELYFANNRVASLEIRINGKDGFVAKLPDELRPWHFIELPKVKDKMELIDLKILSVHKGKRFDDTAISAISLRAAFQGVLSGKL